MAWLYKPLFEYVNLLGLTLHYYLFIATVMLMLGPNFLEFKACFVYRKIDEELQFQQYSSQNVGPLIV